MKRFSQGVTLLWRKGVSLSGIYTLNSEESRILINNLVARYGEVNRARIEELVGQYENDRYIRSIRDVEDLVRGNVTPSATRPATLNFNEADKPMLPTGITEIPVGERNRLPTIEERRSALRHMEFNSVTFLTAKVYLSNGESFTLELRNREGRNNEGHAEMLLLSQISEHLRNLKGVGVRQITITINNSPCGLCGPDIAKWAAQNGNPRIVIHFTNPYGKVEEFVHSVDSMRREGIELHDFNPMDHAGSETDEEMAMEERRGDSIKSRFNKQVLKGRRVLEATSTTPSRRQRDEEKQPEPHNPNLPSFSMPVNRSALSFSLPDRIIGSGIMPGDLIQINGVIFRVVDLGGTKEPTTSNPQGKNYGAIRRLKGG